MSYSFTKLFSSITDSSIWSEDSDTKVVWVTLMAMSDRKGRVMASIPGLSKRSGVALEKTEEAVAKFMQPDKYSRSKEHEGRRIEEIKGGWRLLNYEHYRELRDDEAEKERKRKWWIKTHGKEPKKLDALDGTRPELAGTSADSTQAEAEAEAEAEKNTLPQTPSAAAKVKAPRKPRERNPLFDELAKLDGWSESNPLTGTAGGRVGSALSDIRTACPHVTAEEIARRVRNYQSRYPDAAITSTALASNWALCDTGAQPAKKKYDDRPL